MQKDDYTIRSAGLQDIAFLVKTIIEAEKSGTDILSYSTVFGLDEQQSAVYLSKILFEGVDGCELSTSSFLIAEIDEKPVAAVSAWIEEREGIPSSLIKGSLLASVLPNEAILKSSGINCIISQLYAKCIPMSLQIGLVYVLKSYRGFGLAGRLINAQIIKALKDTRELRDIYVQVFGNNLPAIKSYQKIGFKIEQELVAKNRLISSYLPSDKKIIMKMTI
jgi:GNAT superfamily N-acetyltransferase